MKKSISEVCRDIGINRQQFNRYLSGAAKPSGNNLYKIARYFDIAAEVLFLPAREFAEVAGFAGDDGQTSGSDRLVRLIQETVHRKTKNLRRFVGYYQSYFVSPERGGMIASAFISLHETDGVIYSKSYERPQAVATTGRYFSKYEGVVSESSNSIFIVEFEVLSKDSIVETILYKPYRRQLGYLSGTTMGMDFNRKPFCAPIIWKFLGLSPDIRKALGRAGVYSFDDPAIDASVRKLLSQPIKGGLPLITGADWYLRAD